MAFKTEQPTTLFYAASGENANNNLHPTLEIEHTLATDIEGQDINTSFSISSLGNGFYSVHTSEDQRIDSYSLINMNGQFVEPMVLSRNKDQVILNFSDLPKGMYIVEVRNAGSTVRKMLLNID